MIRRVVIYPDKRLKEISKEVKSFDSELHKLLDDMYDTMIDKRGVGLAAIQIGEARRALIINIPIESAPEGREQPKENTLEIINPKIVEKEGGVKKFQEGWSRWYLVLLEDGWERKAGGYIIRIGVLWIGLWEIGKEAKGG